MDYILSIAAYVAIAAIVAVSLAPLVVILQLITIFKIRRLQMSQADFDAKVEALIAVVEAEKAQIAEFIAGLPPEIDTSALDGFGDRIKAIFEPVAEVVEEEPPVEEPTEKEG